MPHWVLNQFRVEINIKAKEYAMSAPKITKITIEINPEHDIEKVKELADFIFHLEPDVFVSFSECVSDIQSRICRAHP